MSEMYRGVPKYGDGKTLYSQEWGFGRKFSLVHYGEAVSFYEIQKDWHVVVKTKDLYGEMAAGRLPLEYVEGLVDRSPQGDLILWVRRKVKDGMEERHLTHRSGQMVISRIEGKSFDDFWVYAGQETKITKEQVITAYHITPALEDPV